jgi:hypothetical protein
MIKFLWMAAFLMGLPGCGGGNNGVPNPLPAENGQKKASGNDQSFSGFPMLSREATFEIFKKNWRLYGLFPGDCNLDPRKLQRTSDYMEGRYNVVLMHVKVDDTCSEDYQMEKSVSLESDVFGPRVQLVVKNPRDVKRCPASQDKDPTSQRTFSLQLDTTRKYIKMTMISFHQCYWAELETD